MRSFNEDERFFLDIIVKEQNEKKIFFGVATLFQKLAIKENVIIQINQEKKTSCFLSEKLDKLSKDSNSPTELNRWSETQYEEEYNLKSKIAALLSLLDYLEKNNLIYLSELWGNPFLEVFTEAVTELKGEIHIKNHLNKINLLKGDNFEYIFKKLYYDVIPSTELIEFVKKGYKDEEQLRHEENVQLQKDSLEVAKSLGKKSIRIANRSLYIALISLIPSFIPLMRDCSRQEEPGITNNNQPTKQQVKSSNSDTLADNKRQITVKNSTDSGLLKSKLPPTDTTKKQILVDSLRNILPRDTQKK